MSVVKGLVGAGLGSIAGAAVWALLASLTHYEFGIVAWALGAAAGFGMVLGSGGRGGFWLGASAALIAIVGILSGKLLVAHVIASEHVTKMIDTIGEDEAIASIRDDVMTQWLSEDRAMTWPAQMTREEAIDEGYVPPEVEREAGNRWRPMSEEDRHVHITGLKVEANENSAGMTVAATVLAFVFSFGLFDLLWCVLAIGSAYTIGARKSQVEAAALSHPAGGTGATIAQGAAGAAQAAAPNQPVQQRQAPVPRPAPASTEDSASKSFFRGASVTDDFPDPAAKFMKKRADTLESAHGNETSGNDRTRRDAA